MPKKSFTTKEEKPQVAVSGAVRSVSEGKGRFDLVSPFLLARVGEVADENLLPEECTVSSLIDCSIEMVVNFQICGRRELDLDLIALSAYYLFEALEVDEYSKPHADNSAPGSKFTRIPPGGLRRLAQVYERGAAMRGERNWEKGFELTRCIDSCLRHLSQYVGGDREEDHVAQALWNLAAYIHFEECVERGILPASLGSLQTYLPVKKKGVRRG